MSATVPPTPSRRDQRRQVSRGKAIRTTLISAGSVLVLIAIAGVVWVGFAPARKSDHVAAVTSPTTAPVLTPTPTPTPTALTREQMAATPPMGWNSWNQVRCNDLSAKVVENAADAIVAKGLKAVGYEYVVVDDCWQSGRDSSGNLIPDPRKFPDGMKAVADYVHKDGLKFGIYAVPGSQTCANYFDRYPVHGIGSIGHEQQDANLFASWGVDYLKYDWCRADINDKLSETATFRKMEQDLDATGRDIVLSISEYGEGKPWLWAPGIANLWRTTHDIHPIWSSVMQHIDAQVPVTKYAKPGAWNDPDMLEIGNGGLTSREDTSHFAMWCMLAAPLFVGTNIDRLPAATVSLLTNPELIAIDQDALGHEGHLVSNNHGIQVWMRPLSGGSFSIALFNTSASVRTMAASLASLGIPAGTYQVRDVINRTDEAATSTSVAGSAAGHGIVMLKLTPAS